jgi:hypothetical protein
MRPWGVVPPPAPAGSPPACYCAKFLDPPAPALLPVLPPDVPDNELPETPDPKREAEDVEAQP